MANANKPTGLAPKKYLGGADWDGKMNFYYIDSGDGSAYYQGDLVKLSGSGSATGIPGLSKSAAGDTSVGVLVAVAGVNLGGGPYVDPNALGQVYIPATKTKSYVVGVVDDPNVIFEAQEAGAGSNLAVTNIGENINIVVALPSVQTVNAYSGSYLDNNAHDTSSTKNCKILRLVQRVDNALGLYAKWEVLLNNHAYRAGITGV